jgi:hypothetical protein
VVGTGLVVNFFEVFADYSTDQFMDFFELGLLGIVHGLVVHLWLPPFTRIALILKSKYSLRVHFLVALRTVFIDNSKDKGESEEKINSE